MAVSRESFYFKQFTDLLFSVDLFDYPATWIDDSDIEIKEKIILEKLEKHLDQFSKETAAVIIEPLVQGAGGMNVCRPEFLQKCVILFKSHRILIIFDEVMTGFGRTGELFACLKSNTQPDIICLSKGLTGGFMPLSVTACSDFIYEAFLGNDFSRALGHSHSFTANPLGCAASLASLDLLLLPETQSQIKMIEKIHKEELLLLSQQHSQITKTRYCGTIAAFDLVLSADYGSATSIQLRERFLKQGLIIRPLGSIIYLLPPYCISEIDLKRAYEIIRYELNQYFQ